MMSEDNQGGIILLALPSGRPFDATEDYRNQSFDVIGGYLKAGFRFVSKEEYHETRDQNLMVN